MREHSARLVTLGIALLLTVNLAPFAWAAPGDPVAVNGRTGAGYATIQAALTAASSGDTITVLMSDPANPVVYREALSIVTNGVTLCATVALGACAPISAPGRWEASGSTIASPPVQFQGDAIRAPSPGSTSFYATSQDPLAEKLQVSEIDALSFAFLLETGACTSGGVRFQLRLDTTGDSTPEKTIFAYPAPGFCTQGVWRTVDIMNGGTWGLNQVGGTGADTKAAADALTANMNVTTINLVYDGAAAGSVAWFDNERINDAVFREAVDMTCLDANFPACTTVDARPATILDAPAGSSSTVQISGNDVTLQGFTIRNSGAGSTQAVRFTGSGARILGNDIEGNGPLSGTQFGIQASGSGTTGWLVADNTISNTGHTGIYVSGSEPGTIADNVVNQNRANALYTEGGVGLLTIERNDLTQALQANLRVTGTRPMVLRDNTLGLSEFTMDFYATDLQVTDARYNDWGAYSREDIEATINNVAGRALDISCYYGVDGVAVCPAVPDFTFAPAAPHFNAPVQFTDASVAGGNDIASYAYSFGDSTMSTAASPSHAFAHSGVFPVTLTVTDDEGFASSVTKSVGVSNAAPVLAPIPAKAGSEGVTLAFALSATDTDADPITYSGVSLPTGATINPTTGAFSWKPTFTQSGAYTLTVRATDGDLTSTQTVDVAIANVDRAPTLAAIANRNVVELASLNVALSAADADGDAVVLSATGLPAWATLVDNGNGAGSIAGSPGLGERGVSTVTVTATAGSLSASRTFTINVQQAVALTFSAVGPTTFHTSPGQTIMINATITNGGSDTDTFNLALTNTRGWTGTTLASVTLAPGESAVLSATLTAPAKNEKTTIAWKATSATTPSVTRTIAGAADTPVALSFQLVGTPSVLDGARATAKATWLDGSAATGLAITASQTDDLVGMSESTSGMTDAAGEFAVVFDDISAGLPGSHAVVVVLNTPLLPKLQTSYDIGGLP